ncbi:hypothetical protein Taro_005828 [Colocasia esculenta]|uniref:Uncharacterized protein n=1 Tax=Colocasia esculenta TaxID=4460 RepID=A0A843TYZ5_COLES|nr:hypothetical protein [Colocasia esculenta]
MRRSETLFKRKKREILFVRLAGHPKEKGIRSGSPIVRDGERPTSPAPPGQNWRAKENRRKGVVGRRSPPPAGEKSVHGGGCVSATSRCGKAFLFTARHPSPIPSITRPAARSKLLHSC